MAKRLVNAKKEIDANKTYSIDEALELAKKTATTKFVGNIELHIRLTIDPKKTEQTVRSTVTLPHGTGKTKKIAAFVTESKETEAKEAGAAVVGGEELIKRIKETSVSDFDMAIAEPAMMSKLGQIAKILGPRGLMPNPKSGTVTAEIGKVVKEFATGRMEFKNDASGIVHLTLGKTNLDDSALLDNFKTFIKALNQVKPAGLKKNFIESLTLHATMGPAIKIKM